MKEFYMRFWSKVWKGPGCWIWQGALSSPVQGKNYGNIMYLGRNMKAHRASWMMANGKIPKGMDVLHRCDNPPCVRPSHLFLGTAKDNSRDMYGKGRGWQQQKTHCPRKHPYSGANLIVDKRGQRSCRVCRAMAWVKWAAKELKRAKEEMKR